MDLAKQTKNILKKEDKLFLGERYDNYKMLESKDRKEMTWEEFNTYITYVLEIAKKSREKRYKVY